MKEAPCLMEPKIGATRFFLTGRAARKEVYFASESPENQRLLLAAMEREWKKWKDTRQHCH